jgi:hypothetical protein
MLFVDGKFDPTLNSSLVIIFSVPLNLYEIEIGWLLYSSTSNYCTWKFGESIAAWRAHPLAMQSVELRVRFGSFPKTSVMFLMTAGIRVASPTSSMKSISSCFNPKMKIRVNKNIKLIKFWKYGILQN